jgi:hypothetical protein
MLPRLQHRPSLEVVPVVQPPSPPPVPSQNPCPPPQHYSEIMDELHQTLGIRDPDPEYDEVEEGVEGSPYSCCADLLEDDDGDDEYNQGGGLKNLLCSTDMQHHTRCALPPKRRRQGQAGQVRVQGDNGVVQTFLKRD